MDRQFAFPLRQVRRSAAFLAIGALVLIAALAPDGLLHLENGVGYAVCGQLPSHSFWLNGSPMPLCARCTGQYLGALAGFLGLAAVGRGRASRLPGQNVLIVLALCFAAWALDGLNSLLASLPGLVHLYEPHNDLRLAAGLLMGVSLSLLLAPAFNSTLWADARPVASVQRLSELLAWGAAAAGLWIGVVAGWPVILYPLAALSVAGVLLLLTLINTMFWQLLHNRFAAVQGWQQALGPLAIGGAAAIIEVIALGAGRAALETAIGVAI